MMNAQDTVHGATPWWQRRAAELEALADAETPLYVYDLDQIAAAAARLGDLRAPARRFYAVKANSHPQVLRACAAAGLGLECVSAGELEHLARHLPELPAERVLFTPNFAPREEYALAFERGVHVTLDGLYPLHAWPELLRDRAVLLRLDPGRGEGHHAHVRTAGEQSKFGLAPDQLPALHALREEVGVRVAGLSAHAGSGITDAAHWGDTARFLAQMAGEFPEVEVLNVGGGLAVPEHAGQDALDLDAVDRALGAVAEAHPRYRLWLEPGRYLVAEAGVLLTRVTQLKTKGTRRYVGVDTGMNSLIRPALYGARHEIVALTRRDQEPTGNVTVVGPICETGDTLAADCRLPTCREGDVLCITRTGAYGHSMSSSYNLRPPAREVVLPSAADGREAGGPRSA